MEAEEALAAAVEGVHSLCTTTLLPGILALGTGQVVTLAQAAVYHAPCPTLAPRDDYTSSDADGEISSSGDDAPVAPGISDFRDPFYSSNFPLSYALAATTITSYMLVLVLFITPRSFLDGGIVYLGRRGFTNSSSAGVNIGGRPWLQKLAALTVAISLTVASADTFKVAQRQYTWGIQNAKLLQIEVMGSTELKVIRIISDTFLWLAQAQTLIRLFPRQRQKVIIKWAAFALISLDVVFSALNSFMYSSNGVTANEERPKNFVHPVPALSYLFELSLGLLYAGWVIYYALMKKRYAFYHAHMKNICLIAFISIIAVLIPVVFFILDISKPDVAGWGDYVRWVGAAAASVVVWEWVERIEALEREDKKDGILGREVFDGEDILEVDAVDFLGPRNRKPQKGGMGGDITERHHGFLAAHGWSGVGGMTARHRMQGHATNEDHSHNTRLNTSAMPPHMPPARPAPAVTPVSRTDTGSAGSTVYAVRYQAGSETTRTPDPPQPQGWAEHSPSRSRPPSEDTSSSNRTPSTHAQNGHAAPPLPRGSAEMEANGSASASSGWRTITLAANPLFHRDTAGEPGTRSIYRQSQPVTQSKTRDMGGRWELRSRLEDFAANQAEKIREKIRPTADTASLPVTVIPAPARPGAALQQVLEEEELNNAAAASPHPEGQGQGNGSTRRETPAEMIQPDPGRNALSSGSLPQDAPLQRPINPPLWPGIQPRYLYEDEDEEEDYSFDDEEDSMSRSSSGPRGSDEVPGPSSGS